MALAYVGGQTFVSAGTTSSRTFTFTSLTGGIGTAPAAGDLVIFALNVAAGVAVSPTLTTTGYTTVEDIAGTTVNKANLSLHWKFMPATPDTRVIFVSGGQTTDGMSGVAHVWRGVDTGTPLSAVLNNVTSGGPPDPPALTPDVTGAKIVCLGAEAAVTGAVFTTSDLSNFLTANSADTYDAMIGAGSYDWSSGQFDPAQFGGGTTGADDSSVALSFWLNPAPEPVGGLIKVWDGATHAEKPVKAWSGSAFETKPLKYWSGAAWVLS